MDKYEEEPMEIEEPLEEKSPSSKKSASSSKSKAKKRLSEYEAAVKIQQRAKGVLARQRQD